MRAAQAADELAHSHRPLPVSGGVYQVIEDALVHAEQGSVVVHRWGWGGRSGEGLGNSFVEAGEMPVLWRRTSKEGQKEGQRRIEPKAPKRD